MKTGEIIAINISPRRGTQKKEIPEVNLIKGFGLENDAHGGNWHRQVSLLSFEELVVTQIGKECHKHCQIYARVGDCIMPREGIFAVVVTEGHIKKGDQLDVV